MRLRLQIEYGRLLDWGDAAGITESQEIFDKKMRANGAIVMALLGEMRSLLKSMRNVSLRYDSMVETRLVEHKSQQRLQPIDTVNMKEYRAIFESADIPKDKRKYPKGLGRLVELASGGKEIFKHPKRLRWAMADEKKFREHLDRMRELTNFLHETLGDHQTKILMETTRDTYLAVLQLTKDIHQMKAVADAAPAPNVADSESEDTTSIFSQAETLVDGPLQVTDNTSSGTATRETTIFEQLAAFRAVNTSLYSADNVSKLSIPEIDPNEGLVDLKQIGAIQRMTAVYKGRNVWIEWKPYQRDDEIVTENDILYQLSEKVKTDAERLVMLLRAKEKPAEFCVPDCAGYFDDSEHDRFGFVYEVPRTALRSFKLKSLLQLFNNKPASLKARVSLAQRLATCVLYLHAANWLHKSLRSASILFFSEEEVLDMSSPYISSFEYSRPDENTATMTGAPKTPEWAVYCHPDYLGRPGYFRKTYDIYSLGMILLEIAYWRPAEAIFGLGSKGEHDITTQVSCIGDEPIVAKQQTESLDLKKLRKVKEIRNWLLLDEAAGGKPEYLEHVRGVMGDRYHNAVKACISGVDYFHLPKEVDQTDSVIATLIQQAYLRLVVDVLHGVIV